MSLLERLENFKTASDDHHDILYLKNSELGSVVNRGLAELYKSQPKNPVTFLANWLLNESRSKEIKKKIDESNELKNELKHQYEKEQKIKDAQRRKEEEVIRIEEAKKEEFVSQIKSCHDFENNMNSFCQHLKVLASATGVYVMTYDKKRKIPVSVEEDETAHLLEEKVLRYIYFCEDHESLLKNKHLEPGSGVTYDLIMPKEETAEGGDKPQEDLQGEGADMGNSIENQMPKEAELRHKEVKEIIGSDEGVRIKFFDGPRLGSYLAIDMTFKTSFLQQSLLSAIENKKDYEKNLLILEEKRKEWEDHMALLQKEKEKVDTEALNNPGNEENNVHQGSNEIEGFVEEKVELLDFYREEKRLIFALDTLGQDRPFSDKEKQYIFEVVKTLKNSWEKLEETLLLKCRDLKIDLDNTDKLLKETNPQDKLDQEEEKYLKEHFETEYYVQNPITDEKEKEIQTEFRKTRLMINHFLHDENMNQAFLMYAQFEFIEFERLFQNTLYFIGVSNTDINEENTNKLDWKKARKFWNKSVLAKLEAYVPFGPKPGALSYFAMGNRLFVSLESINKEDLKHSSFVLYRLLEFLLMILRVRRDDIVKRRKHIDELMEKRRLAIEQRNEREEHREKALEEARKLHENPEEGAEVEPLNEEEFLTKYDEEHPEVEIPEELYYDVDEDMDVDKLTQ